MAVNDRTVRLDLSPSQLEAAAWAVFYSSPAAPNTVQAALAEVEEKILAKRRQLLADTTTTPLAQMGPQGLPS